MLSLKEITLINHEKVIFSGLSVSFLASAIILLTGNNGTGKSSLLRIIAGLQEPTKGSITYGKNNIPLSAFSLPYCTYIGHKTGFKQELSILENLTFAARLYNAEELINAAIGYFALEELLAKKYYQLSAGNQQKLALARLIICPAKLWLLDEVEMNLDQDNKAKLHNLITIQANNGGIVISASHNPAWSKTITTINMEDFSV